VALESAVADCNSAMIAHRTARIDERAQRRNWLVAYRVLHADVVRLFPRHPKRVARFFRRSPKRKKRRASKAAAAP
jgi:hypothetical protein